MQKAIPYKSSWTSIYSNIIFRPKNNDQMQISHVSSSSSGKRRQSVLENAVVMFARRGCCLGHVAKRLLLTHGVNPLVNEVDDDEDEANVLSELGEIFVGSSKNNNISNNNNNNNDDDDDDDSEKEKKINQLPMVFIGGKPFGGLDNLMAAHINGDLVPLLKRAGALWL